MTSSDMVVCTLYDEGASKDAVTWCTECEEFLCIDCERHHQKSKMSKDHTTISTEVYKKLPKCIQEIKSQCRDHKNKFELYCSFHACHCCVQCVTDKHKKKCQDMKPLSDILKEIKSSASVQLLEKDLTDVKRNFEETISYLKSRMNTSNIQKTAVEKIRSIKTSIDDFFTKIEQVILADLETKHSKLNSKMNILIQQLEQQANQIDKWLSGFTEMTRFATELQMYVGLLEIEKVTSEADKYIEDLRNGKHLNENNLEVTISSSLQSILKDVKALGKVDIYSSPSSLRIKAGRKDQAQDLVRLVPQIEEIKPTILRTLAIPKGIDIQNVFACIILPDGRFIILDNQNVNGQLLLFSNDGMFIRQILAFTGESWDACFVKNNTVAVLFESSNEITLVDIEKNEITDQIKLPGFSGSIASDGQLLVTSCMGSTIVNMDDMSQTAVFFLLNQIALFKGDIYGTFEQQVYCYTCTGELLWELQNRDIVQPIGIELDVNGFIYIVSNGNDSIVVVSPDGKTCKTILSEAGGISMPYAIGINRETGIMLLSSIGYDGSVSNSANVYQI